MEHDNLTTNYGLKKTKTNNVTNLSIEYTKVNDGYDLNELSNGRVRTAKFINAPQEDTWFFVSAWTESKFTIQDAIKLVDSGNRTYRRLKYNGVWGEWREQVGDKSVIDTLLAQKQKTLTSNASIGVTSNNTLRQLYLSKQTYMATDGMLKAYIKSVTDNSHPDGQADEQFNFIVKLNKGVSSVNFTLNSHHTTKFSNIMSAYGSNNTVRISGCVFTLSGSTLTVATANNTAQNYVITFSDII